MDASEILSTAETRIRANRTADIRLRFKDASGQPLAPAEVDVRLVRHAFKLGANAFRVNDIADPALQDGYDERFAALLNYATLPFYWGSYESRPGITNQAHLEEMADWCSQHGIAAKGHPLVWHTVFPDWAATLDDAEVISRLQARVSAIVGHFKGRIDIWDVVNEATVSHTVDNAVGRWIKRDGAAACAGRALRWANEANPAATLLYNDFNISSDFETLAGDLLHQGAPLQAIGIQSHMHQGTWPDAKVWSVCETYARFGLPLHFTETTVLSGRLKAPDDDDWMSTRTDWPTTAEGEAAQLKYGASFFTILFSHPAVEAITWWDFSDLGSWQGAPSGLVRADMTPKPLYDWLMDAFHRRWTAAARIAPDSSGIAIIPACYFGAYEVRARTASGRDMRGTFTLEKAGLRDLVVPLS